MTFNVRPYVSEQVHYFHAQRAEEILGSETVARARSVQTDVIVAIWFRWIDGVQTL
jgi:hypothetical protein